MHIIKYILSMGKQIRNDLTPEDEHISLNQFKQSRKHVSVAASEMSELLIEKMICCHEYKGS